MAEGAHRQGNEVLQSGRCSCTTLDGHPRSHGPPERPVFIAGPSHPKISGMAARAEGASGRHLQYSSARKIVSPDSEFAMQNISSLLRGVNGHLVDAAASAVEAASQEEGEDWSDIRFQFGILVCANSRDFPYTLEADIVW